MFLQAGDSTQKKLHKLKQFPNRSGEFKVSTRECFFRLNVVSFPAYGKLLTYVLYPKTKPIAKDRLRPISLLPIISKVFKLIILKKYSSSLVRCYDKQQFAYRRESSTVCALLFIQDNISSCWMIPMWVLCAL